jgi:hypothetical protein
VHGPPDRDAWQARVGRLYIGSWFALGLGKLLCEGRAHRRRGAPPSWRSGIGRSERRSARPTRVDPQFARTLLCFSVLVRLGAAPARDLLGAPQTSMLLARIDWKKIHGWSSGLQRLDISSLRLVALVILHLHTLKGNILSSHQYSPVPYLFLRTRHPLCTILHTNFPWEDPHVILTC